MAACLVKNGNMRSFMQAGYKQVNLFNQSAFLGGKLMVLIKDECLSTEYNT